MQNSQKKDRISNKKAPKYAILGCGSVGVAVANELRAQGKEFIVIDKDPQRVESLRDQKFEAIQGNISDEKALNRAHLENFGAVLILSSNVQANKIALKIVQNISPIIHTVVRAIDPVTKEKLEDAGADMVLLPSSIIATTAAEYLERVESVRHGRELLKLMKGVGKKGKLGIIIHDNPDPDAIASGLALKYMAEHISIDAEVLYQGDIGHQENRAFINLLKIQLRRINESNLSEFNKIALVDASIPGANNSLPEDVEVEIVIDHHLVDLEKVDAHYCDIRPKMGATATIMTGYLQELGISISKELATALLYGIRTDTHEFKVETSPADLTAAAFLYPLADHELLGKVEMPSMSTETLDILGEAIQSRRTKGSYLISNVGLIQDRDALPQAADYLLNLEGITTVVVFGLGGEHIYVSGRSKDIRLNIGSAMKEAFGDIGSAGGHSTAAAAQIPLGVFSGVKDKQTIMRLSEEAVMKRFLAAVGEKEDK
ncbi:MAG: NAD(P)-binding domain-containing protein [Methanocellales archaeon]|nr:NAD(P)-binding domain-containing protein [Methanocellales archaeon]